MNDFIINSGTTQGPTPSTQAVALVKITNTENFVADVIEPSNSHPVIVLFTAPNHAICRSLETILETLVQRAGGLVSLAKVTIDENQQLAQQLRIQSVPTVFGFQGGRAVDAFAGMQSESQVQSFVDKLIGDAKPPMEIAMDHAQEAMQEQRWSDAEEIYTEIFAQDSTYEPALAGLIKAKTAQGQFDVVQDLIHGLEAKVKNSTHIAGAIAGFQLAQESMTAKGADLDSLQQSIEQNPKDFEARFDLAKILFSQDNTELAIEHLLEIVRLNRSWNEEAARKQLIKIFDALGPADPITIDSRKKLSAVLFS